MTQKIEVVGTCSANVERSATFWAVTNQEVQNQQLEQLLGINSAGMVVEKILANQSPLHIQIKILRAGLHYRLIRDEIRTQVEQVVERGVEQEHTDNIRVLYGEIRPLVHGLNIGFRNQALSEAGITVFPPPYTPFDVKQGFNLVLPMAKKDIVKVEARYQSADMSPPTIQTYGSLVGVEQLVDNVKGGLEGARERVAYFMDTRKIGIERMMEYV